MSILTISGDGQAGKSAAALTLAIDNAARGRRVLITTQSPAAAHEMFLRARQEIPDSCIARVVMARGRERIEIDRGGQISFISRTRDGGRGMAVDTLILDEWDNNQTHWENLVPAVNASRDPRIILVPLADQ